MTTYRENEYSELCGECRQPTGLACRACARPTCERHQIRHRLCPGCTAELTARLEELGPPPPSSGRIAMPYYAAGVVVLMVAVFSGVMFLGGIGLALWVLALAVAIGGRGARQAWRLRHREILSEMLDRNQR
jgi:hypothetical protein